MQVFLVKFKVVPDDIKRRRAKTNVSIYLSSLYLSFKLHMYNVAA